MNIDLLNVLFGSYSYDNMVMVAGRYPVEASARGQAVWCVYLKRYAGIAYTGTAGGCLKIRP